MIFTAEKCAPGLWHLGGGRYIGVDFGSDDRTVECEVRQEADGTVTVLDIREFPAARPER